MCRSAKGGSSKKAKDKRRQSASGRGLVPAQSEKNAIQRKKSRQRGGGMDDALSDGGIANR